MKLTIILSGPKTAEQQARTALASAGYSVQGTSHDHGLPTTATGKKIRQAVTFLTVEADDIDAVSKCVSSLGYVLRMHHETQEPPEPSIEQQLAQQLAEIRADLDELKRRVA